MTNKSKKLEARSYRLEASKGFSLLDVLIGVALLVLVFVGIFGVFKLSIAVIGNGKAKVGAVSLANDRAEFIRSLAYDDVGVVGGIPSGLIPAEETILLNNISYTRRVFVQFVDSPADGVGGADTNGITADYKVAKVQVLWTLRADQEKDVTLVTNIVPKGIETVAGGGTLVINVLDAIGLPVAAAEVRIENSTIIPSVDITTFSNIAGQVVFPGTPDANDYKVTITKALFSTDGTYDTTAENTNPDPPHLSVLEGQTTTATFQIDAEGSKIVRTFEAIKRIDTPSTFDDTSQIEIFSNTELVGGEVRLVDTALSYPSSGDVHSTTTEPQYLAKWLEVLWNDTEPPDTNILYEIHYEDTPGSFILVPDIDLAGNSSGFDNSPINLTPLNIGTFQALRIVGRLSTIDASITPSIQDWQISYNAGPTPLPSIAFSMRGNKTIGSGPGGSPIYKYESDLNSGVNASTTMPGLEWDNYTITIDNVGLNLDIGESCKPQPRSLLPNVNITTDLIFVPHTTNSLLVDVNDGNGLYIEDAGVRLYRLPFDETLTSSICGQVHFNSLSVGTVTGGNPYFIDVVAAGYENITVIDVDVIGASTVEVIVTPL